MINVAQTITKLRHMAAAAAENAAEGGGRTPSYEGSDKVIHNILDEHMTSPNWIRDIEEESPKRTIAFFWKPKPLARSP